MELGADGTVLARTPTDDIIAIKADELSTLANGIDGEQIRAAVSLLARGLIAMDLGVEIGESGYPEEPFNGG